MMMYSCRDTLINFWDFSFRGAMSQYNQNLQNDFEDIIVFQ